MGYNLNFVPTPANIKKKEILEDVKKFNRKIKLKAHFETSLPEGNLYFKSESNWVPNNVHHTVKTFTDDFTNRITQSINKDGQNIEPDQKNLNKKEVKALNDLKNREDIIISKADKGRGGVIMDVDD